MRSSLIRLSYLSGVAFVTACPAPKSDDTSITIGDTDTESATTITTANPTTSTTSDEASSSSGTPGESSSGGEVTTTTASDTGDPECGPGISCGVPAPDGWFGPTIIATTDGTGEGPACPEGYEQGPIALEGFIDPGPAVCECECSVQGLNCTAYSYSYTGGACNAYSGYSNVSETCTNFAISGSAYFYTYANGNPTCSNEKIEEFAPAQWESTVYSCKLADGAETCNGDGICQPNPPGDFEATSCIYQQGDVGCPAGAYNTKHLYNTGVDDTRDCGDCTCGVPATNCNNSDGSIQMQVFDQADCPGAPSAFIPNNYTCTPATGVAVAVDYGTDSACPVASQPQPEGEVTPVGAFTFCCMG
jgi:hypothetical protein